MDSTDTLKKIKERMCMLRNGERCEYLLSKEENRHLEFLAMCFAKRVPFAAFKAFYTLRGMITFNGIFMASGYEQGKENFWSLLLEKQVECM